MLAGISRQVILQCKPASAPDGAALAAAGQGFGHERSLGTGPGGAIARAMSIIVSDPAILGGTPCFRGTRVPVEAVFANLADGHSLQDVLEMFPTVDPDDARAVVAQSTGLWEREALAQAA